MGFQSELHLERSGDFRQLNTKPEARAVTGLVDLRCDDDREIVYGTFLDPDHSFRLCLV